MHQAIEIRETIATIAEPTCAPCVTCGEMTAPDGTCLEVGACSAADSAATRGAARQTAKYGVPAAWNARGSVD
jgi:hypothetical protein